MRDPSPRTDNDNEKYWVTIDSENQVLYEYSNKTVYSYGNATFTHRLEYPFVVISFQFLSIANVSFSMYI